MITRLRWWWLLWSWWSSWYRNETVAILGIWLTKGAAAFYQKDGRGGGEGVVGGQIHGAYQILMSTSIVRVTLIFSHVQCVRREGYAHTLLHWRVRWQEGPSILSNKILSQTGIDDEDTLLRKGAFNDGFFEKISTAYISSFKKSESLRLTWASVNQYPSVLR